MAGVGFAYECRTTGCSRLQAAESRVETLSAGRPDRQLLLIALTYAARVQQRWDYVENFSLILPVRVTHTTSDIKLLLLDRANELTQEKLNPPLWPGSGWTPST